MSCSSSANHFSNPGICLCDDTNEVNNVVVDIAVIAEDLPNISRDTAKTQYLEPIDITYNEFHNLFYFNNGKFTPNIALGCTEQYSHHVKHENKKILHQNGKNKTYNLLEELIEHYQTHLEDPPDCWDPCTRIEFEKKIGSIKSLFDVGVCNVTCSLTLDEFFDAIQANGVEINPHTHMPSLSGQEKRVIALVTTKFISNNHATETDSGVPDLNITWPFRINFSANVKAPQAHGCGDCGKYKTHIHIDHMHGLYDHNCDTHPHKEHEHPGHEARTLEDLVMDCNTTTSTYTIVSDLYHPNGEYKNPPGLHHCHCLKRLHIKNGAQHEISSTHQLAHIISPWPCTDWCEGDRYRTSYNMAKWEFKCHAVNLDCSAIDVSANTPSTVDEYRWQQICHNEKHHNDKEHHCKNIVVNPNYTHHHHGHHQQHHHHPAHHNDKRHDCGCG